MNECKPRYFYDQNRDRLVFVEQNPCGCCHFSLLVEWGKGYTQSYLLGFKNDVEIEEYLEKWIEL